MLYLVLGFDDNTYHDRRVVELLNQYLLKGTFFINSGTLNNPGFITKEELDTLYTGHEVASHGFNHLNLKDLSKDEVRYQINEDIQNIESYSKQKVKGFAYPYGDFNKKVQDVIKELGLLYARTSKGSKEFDKPKNFLEWNPTLHFSGMAYNTDDLDRVNKGYMFMLDKLEEFLEDSYSGVFFVWMHSWELGEDKDAWDRLERLFRIISQEDDLETVTASQYFQRVSK